MGCDLKPRIVLSGVNLVEAGPLAIFQDALTELAASFANRYEIVALVHRRTLFSMECVTFLEFPTVKRSWLARLLFEYWQCRALSRELRPELWLSMHDISPAVTAARQAVYCHNPAPFHALTFRAALADSRFALFVWLYRHLYRVNLQSNDFVVVQQQWMRNAFRHFDRGKIIVAHPSVARLGIASGNASEGAPRFRFIYPAFPRSFKNVAALLEASLLLEARGFDRFEVWLTMDGTENSYARRLRARFPDLRTTRWLGRLSRDRVLALYCEADCLLFPSVLETWGMPLSEFRQTGKPILAADLPYAHETVGAYAQVRFFAPLDFTALAQLMEEAAQERLAWEVARPEPIDAPFAKDWPQLFRLLLGEDPAL